MRVHPDDGLAVFPTGGGSREVPACVRRPAAFAGSPVHHPSVGLDPGHACPGPHCGRRSSATAHRGLPACSRVLHGLRGRSRSPGSVSFIRRSSPVSCVCGLLPAFDVRGMRSGACTACPKGERPPSGADDNSSILHFVTGSVGNFLVPGPDPRVCRDPSRMVIDRGLGMAGNPREATLIYRSCEYMEALR